MRIKMSANGVLLPWTDRLAGRMVWPALLAMEMRLPPIPVEHIHHGTMRRGKPSSAAQMESALFHLN